MRNYLSLVIVLLAFIIHACSSHPSETTDSFPALRGPYLGQTLPDSLPVLFAPGIIGTGMFTRDIAMPPSADEIYFCIALGNYTFATMLSTHIENGVWTRPEVVPFASDGKTIDFEPAFSPDGNRLYFLSARPDGNEEAGDQDIWYVDRTKDGWGKPINPGAPLNTSGGEFFPSLTDDGYLYFTHNDPGKALNEIFRSKIVNKSFTEPELLPEQVNCGTNRFNAYVSPKHDYIIVPVVGMEAAYDQVDYYITFRNEEDQWSQPMNLGAEINENNTRGWSAYVSHDGKYFFFMSNKSDNIPAAELNYSRILELHNSSGNGNADIYWMSAGFINDFREKAIF